MMGLLRLRILARDGNRCVYCGATGRLEVDHIYPRALGGSGVDTNLVASCGPCNLEKSDRVLPMPPRPEPLGLLRRRLGGPIADTGLRLGRFATCEDRCPICTSMTRPRFLTDGDAREVELGYRCDIGHPWHAWFSRDLGLLHSDTVRWDAASAARLVPA